MSIILENKSIIPFLVEAIALKPKTPEMRSLSNQKHRKCDHYFYKIKFVKPT